MTTASPKRSRPRLLFPLLGKELKEQAARKRTYVLRVIYAALLYLVGCQTIFHYGGFGVSPLYVLGQGSRMLGALIFIQAWGIYLFLPALMCGVIAQEREKDSLVLLLLTDLGPWELLLEKYFSRLLPMIYFLLLTVPAMAVAYTMGGVETRDVIIGTGLLLVTCIQVGAIALAASTFFRSTSGAFVGSYIAGGALAASPAFVGLVLMLFFRVNLNSYDMEQISHMFIPIAFYEGVGWRAGYYWWGIGGGLSSAAIALLAARLWIVKRALLSPRNSMLIAFKALDKMFHRANIVTGGVVLYKSKNELPADKPVVWWELTKRAIGQPQYLFRILSVFLIPVLFVTVGVVAFSRPSSDDQMEALSAALAFVWPAALLMMVVQSANLFAADRSRQTLDTLLTTPMSGDEILRQKTAALRRLNWILFVPVAMLIGTEVWWETWPWTAVGYGDEHNFYRACRYLFCAGGMAIISFPLVSWISIYASMRIKGQLRAIIVAILVVLAWFVGWPGLIAFLHDIVFRRFGINGDILGWLIFGSPVTIVGLNELEQLDKVPINSSWLITMYLGLMIAICYLVRSICLRSVDRLLGRVTQP